MSWRDYPPEWHRKDKEMIVGYVRKIPVREQVRLTYINIIRDKPVQTAWTCHVVKKNSVNLLFHTEMM